MRIGVINKATSVTEYIYAGERFKTFTDYPPSDYQQYEITQGTDRRAYSWSGSQIVFDSGYVVNPTDPSVLIERLMKNALAFGQQLIVDFGKENVLMGITQLGKTGPVLSVLSSKVDLGDGYPLSLMDTISGGSLHEAVKIIDCHLANMANYSDLSPFITTERLDSFKAKIQDFLA